MLNLTELSFIKAGILPIYLANIGLVKVAVAEVSSS
jgi:hypothetical protein